MDRSYLFLVCNSLNILKGNNVSGKDELIYNKFHKWFKKIYLSDTTYSVWLKAHLGYYSKSQVTFILINLNCISLKEDVYLPLFKKHSKEFNCIVEKFLTYTQYLLLQTRFRNKTPLNYNDLLSEYEFQNKKITISNEKTHNIPTKNYCFIILDSEKIHTPYCDDNLKAWFNYIYSSKEIIVHYRQGILYPESKIYAFILVKFYEKINSAKIEKGYKNKDFVNVYKKIFDCYISKITFGKLINFFSDNVKNDISEYCNGHHDYIEINEFIKEQKCLQPINPQKSLIEKDNVDCKGVYQENYCLIIIKSVTPDCSASIKNIYSADDNILIYNRHAYLYLNSKIYTFYLIRFYGNIDIPTIQENYKNNKYISTYKTFDCYMSKTSFDNLLGFFHNKATPFFSEYFRKNDNNKEISKFIEDRLFIYNFTKRFNGKHKSMDEEKLIEEEWKKDIIQSLTMQNKYILMYWCIIQKWIKVLEIVRYLEEKETKKWIFIKDPKSYEDVASIIKNKYLKDNDYNGIVFLLTKEFPIIHSIVQELNEGMIFYKYEPVFLSNPHIVVFSNFIPIIYSKEVLEYYTDIEILNEDCTELKETSFKLEENLI